MGSPARRGTMESPDIHFSCDTPKLAGYEHHFGCQLPDTQSSWEAKMGRLKQLMLHEHPVIANLIDLNYMFKLRVLRSEAGFDEWLEKLDRLLRCVWGLREPNREPITHPHLIWLGVR
jgi:hypothetical protein